MDAKRFDALTTRLTDRLTRRRLGVLGAAVPAGLVLADSVDAKHRKKKKPCPPCVGRKKGKCKKRLPDGTACSGGTCQGGVCQTAGCPAQRQCGPGCCPEGQVCGSNGACVSPTCCGGSATCDNHTTVDRLCCIAPRVAFCCCDNPRGSGNGYAICCDLGAGECPRGCTGAIGIGGATDVTPGPDGTCDSQGGPADAECVA